MNDISHKASAGLTWLPGISALMTFIACKGTILLVAVFPLLGFTLTINAVFQAAVISVFAVSTSALVLVNHLQYGKNRGPVMLASAGALLVVSVMYIQFNIVIEAFGLAALLIAAIWSGLAGSGSETDVNMAATK
jgi:hypothetical protein